MKNKEAQKLGSIKTEKKSKASAENGKKGGRPKKVIVQLYQIPRESRIKADVYKDVGGVKTKVGGFIIFHRTDGMYSYCTLEGTDTTCHLHVLQPLTLNPKGYYELSK